MDEVLNHLIAALAGRYTLERQIGAGGMGPLMHAEVSGSTRTDAGE